jgi:hypothetical protein
MPAVASKSDMMPTSKATLLTDAVEKVVVLVGRWLDYAGED